MCAWGAPGFGGSPDRLDALVWALSELLLKDQRPRLRPL
jgi:phage terminase large subunit-like protein